MSDKLFDNMSYKFTIMDFSKKEELNDVERSVVQEQKVKWIDPERALNKLGNPSDIRVTSMEASLHDWKEPESNTAVIPIILICILFVVVYYLPEIIKLLE
jgi:hypothetical protein